ncbi:MAG TPA: sodium:alanine symporter family protein, partial [bacterium]|nr:sodium:alanine symporter family protein [bacterium]
MTEMFVFIEKGVSELGALAWGPPMLVFLVGTGIYLTILLKGLQFSRLFYSLKLIFVKIGDEE